MVPLTIMILEMQIFRVQKLPIYCDCLVAVSLAVHCHQVNFDTHFTTVKSC